jgi:hypothetical protein
MCIPVPVWKELNIVLLLVYLVVAKVQIPSSHMCNIPSSEPILIAIEIYFAFLQEDTYEAGIANDMRELEMRLEYELEEQEKRWSSEEESGKK